MTKPSIHGLYTALITPFKNGKVDEKAYADFIEWQISEGVHGLVPCGTTGESPTLSPAEHNQVIEVCIKVAKGRVAVMAGTGSNSTEEAIEFTRHAEKAGADSALLVVPYYNKPTSEGLYQHFKAVHDATDLPLVLYNIPGRSVVNMSDDLIARIAELPRIAGVKDATGDLARVSTLRARVGNKLALLSGEDMTAVGFNAMGGVGCISVASNVAPKLCADVQDACLAGDFKKALAMHETLFPLNNVMFIETNPMPVKYAVSRLGYCSEEIRLPLVMPTEATKKAVDAALAKMGLLSNVKQYEPA